LTYKDSPFLSFKGLRDTHPSLTRIHNGGTQATCPYGRTQSRFDSAGRLVSFLSYTYISTHRINTFWFDTHIGQPFTLRYLPLEQGRKWLEIEKEAFRLRKKGGCLGLEIGKGDGNGERSGTERSL